MHCLDSSFLVDYLHGRAYTRTFIENVTDGNDEFVVPTIVLYELYTGALRTTGPDGIDTLADAVDWAEPLALTEAIAREAARVRTELLDRGTPLDDVDILIAATARHEEAPLVTTDGDFQHVPDLEAVNPRK